MAYIGQDIADVAVTVGQGVIDASHIVDSSITTADIGNDAITANKIDDDGTGFQMGSLGLGTAVSGSHKLTVGGTALFSGDVNFDSNTLFVDASENEVMIGSTTSGRGKLSVVNTGYAVLALGTSSSSGSRGGAINFENETPATEGQILYDTDSDFMQFKTAGTVALTIDSSQRVGIGVSSPETPLAFEPSDTTTATEGIKFQNSSSTSDAIVQPWKFASGMGLILGSNFYIDTTGNVNRFNTGEESSGILIDPRGTLTFSTGGTGGSATSAMTIDSSGNVGIGSTSVTDITASWATGTVLDVHESTGATTANIIISGDTTTNGGSVGTLVWANRNNSGQASEESGAQGKAIATITTSIVTSDSNGGDDSGADLKFFTKPEAGSIAERMRITSGGSVGIGTNNPTEKLTLHDGDILVSSGRGVRANAGNEMIRFNSSDGVIINSGGAQVLTVNTMGAVNQKDITTHVRTGADYGGNGSGGTDFTLGRFWHDVVNWGDGGVIVEIFNFYYGHAQQGYGKFFCTWGYSNNTRVTEITSSGSVNDPTWGGAVHVSGNIYRRDLSFNVPQYNIARVRLTTAINVTTNVNNTSGNTVYFYN